MKKVVLIILILSILLSLVSAGYICSDNSEIVEDREEINELDRKSINGIGIAILDADEFSALGGISAKIIVDAKKASLSNETPSEDVEISGSDYTITLINATDDDAKIKVEGSSDTVDEGEVDTIGGVKVILVKSSSGIGIGNVDVIAGIDEISLSSDTSLFQIFKIEEKEYLAELISASDTDAIISISKCKTGNLIEDEPLEKVPKDEENISEDELLENITDEETSISEVNVSDEEDEDVKEKTSLTSIIMIIMIIIIVGIIIVFFLKTKKKKNYQLNE